MKEMGHCPQMERPEETARVFHCVNASSIQGK